MGDGGSKAFLTHVNLSRSLHITPSSAMSDQPRSLILSDAPSSSTPKVSFSGVSRNRATKKDGGKRIGSFSSRPGPDGFHAADDLQSNNVPLRQPPDTLKDKPSENNSPPHSNRQTVSQPIESTVSSCVPVYTVQAVHGILTSAARAGKLDQTAAMSAKYWRGGLRADQTITIATEDAAFFNQWNNYRETTAHKQHEEGWIKVYENFRTRTTSPDMPLEKFATLGAIAAVLHTRHQPAPSTVASSDLLEFDFRSRPDVERVAPSASGQADRPSTNVAGQTTRPGQTTQPGQSKKIKNHESPG